MSGSRRAAADRSVYGSTAGLNSLPVPAKRNKFLGRPPVAPGIDRGARARNPERPGPDSVSGARDRGRGQALGRLRLAAAPGPHGVGPTAEASAEPDQPEANGSLLVRGGARVEQARGSRVPLSVGEQVMTEESISSGELTARTSALFDSPEEDTRWRVPAGSRAMSKAASNAARRRFAQRARRGQKDSPRATATKRWLQRQRAAKAATQRSKARMLRPGRHWC